MNNTKNIRCPNPKCNKINTIDIKAELDDHQQSIYRVLSNHTNSNLPKTILVTCSGCGEKFKFNLG